MNKKQKIILIVCVTLAILAVVFYFFVYNPKDIFGKNCQTAYNLSHYEYSDGFKIDIPENSCFVNTCCMICHRFRTHENYDSLNAKLQKIVDNYNSNNSERQISYTIEKHLWYNAYSIGY